jgi:hypothetical protein
MQIYSLLKFKKFELYKKKFTKNNYFFKIEKIFLFLISFVNILFFLFFFICLIFKSYLNLY